MSMTKRNLENLIENGKLCPVCMNPRDLHKNNSYQECIDEANEEENNVQEI